jgi:hypothetical protein
VEVWFSLSFSIISVMIATAAVFLANRAASTEMSVTTYQGATQLMLEVDRIFLNHPELRPFFYDDVEPTPDVDRNLINAAVEFMLDAFECIWDQRPHFSAPDYDSWAEYIVDRFGTSPVLRQFYRDHAGWYPTLDSLLKEKAPAPQLQAWQFAHLTQ